MKLNQRTLSFKAILQEHITSQQCRLTHWGRVTQISVSEFTIIGSDNGLLPIWRQAIIWTNAGLLLIQTLGTNFSEILMCCQCDYFQAGLIHIREIGWACRDLVEECKEIHPCVHTCGISCGYMYKQTWINHLISRSVVGKFAWIIQFITSATFVADVANIIPDINWPPYITLSHCSLL